MILYMVVDCERSRRYIGSPTAISMKHTSLAGLAVGNKISENTLNYFNLNNSNKNESFSIVNCIYEITNK